MADQVADLTGREAFSLVSSELDLSAHVSGLDNVPISGAIIIISNHPTGLADGTFVFDALNGRRPDHLYMANADALRVIPKARDIIIPVEWVKEKRSPAKTRETLAAMKSAIANGNAIVIFPSGVLARMTWRGLIDKPWNPTAISMARKHNVPIIPLKIKSRNSYLYYLFSWLNKELRDITLFHELLNKKGSRPGLTFGKPVDPKSLPKGADATQAVRDIVETL